MAVLQYSNLQRLVKSSSFWALTDQGVLSLGTFATNIAVLRAYKYDKPEYATYLLLVSIISLLNNLHASVITYPLSVKGARADDFGLRGLASASLALTGAMAAPMLLVVLIAAALIHSVALAPFVAMAVIAWQLQETTRRALMAHLRNGEAVWGDAVSYLGQAALVVLLCQHHVPPLWEVFTAMAVTSLAGAVVQTIQLRLVKFNVAHTRETATDGWRIGRWLLVTNGLNLLTIQMITWTIFYFHRDNGVAAFGALGNVIGVSHPIMFGICGLIVPGVAKARSHGDDAGVRRFATKLSAIGLALLAPYYLFLMLFPGLTLRIFCGANSPYLTLTTELRWYVAQYVFVYLAFVTAAVLNGLEAGRWTFAGQFANAIVTMFVRIPLTALSGVSAAIWSGVLTYSAQTLVNLYGLQFSRARSGANAERRGFEPIFNSGPHAAATSNESPERLRVLVSAYTISPVRGSEPAGAWQVIIRLAAHHDLTVLTSPNCEGADYRTETLTYLRQHPIPGLKLHYVEPPYLAKKLMRPFGVFARMFYYFGYASWQRAALKAAQSLHENRPFDLTHQLNMTGYREPGYLWKLPIPFTWGPIAGACNMPWSFLSTMAMKERIFYGLRNIANTFQRVSSLRCRHAANAASVIWYVGQDEKELIEGTWQNSQTEPMLDSGTEPTPRQPLNYDGKRPLRLVWSGLHIGRKGMPILLHALAKLKDKAIKVTILGDGPQTERYDSLAADLGVLKMIEWRGRLPRPEALAVMANSDALVFTSLMEAASHVTLEAISMGLPVICHDACGMSIAVDSFSGIKVPLVDLPTSINGFAAAIDRLVNDPAEVQRLTDGVARRATELTWDAKVEQISRAYHRIVAAQRLNRPVEEPEVVQSPASAVEASVEFESSPSVQP